MNPFRLYYKLSRFPPVMFIAIFLISTYYGGSYKIYELITGAVLIFMIYHFATSYNDLCDTKIDRVSNPTRPLVAEPKSRSFVAKIVQFDVAVTTLVLLLNFDVRIAVPSVLMIFLFYFYSSPKFRLKKTFAANVVIGLMALVSGWYGIVFTTVNIQNIGATLFSFLIVSFFTSIKDFKDIKGDRADGSKTLPVLVGINGAARVLQAIAILSLPVGLALKFLIMNSSQWWAYASIIFIATLYVLLLEQLRTGRLDGRVAHKISMVFAPIATFLFAY